MLYTKLLYRFSLGLLVVTSTSRLHSLLRPISCLAIATTPNNTPLRTVFLQSSSMSTPSDSSSTTLDIQRLHVSKRYSEAAVFNGVVYLAGMVPECTETDIRSQTADVLRQVEERLHETNSDKTRILRAQIFLQDIQDIAGMNEVWDSWVVPGTAPPRATVQAALADPTWKIEIIVTAAAKQ